VRAGGGWERALRLDRRADHSVAPHAGRWGRGDGGSALLGEVDAGHGDVMCFCVVV
jgi:hypothetical protein